MPDSAAQTQGVALKGNDWGGHAPIVSGHVYVLQAGTGGYQAGVLNYPRYLSIDISGNLWLSNFNGASVEELIGAAAPVVRPLAAAVLNGTLGTRP